MNTKERLLSGSHLKEKEYIMLSMKFFMSLLEHMFNERSMRVYCIAHYEVFSCLYIYPLLKQKRKSLMREATETSMREYCIAHHICSLSAHSLKVKSIAFVLHM